MRPDLAVPLELATRSLAAQGENVLTITKLLEEMLTLVTPAVPLPDPSSTRQRQTAR